ncbi:Exosome complex component CSL4 [Spathaspora sp. JA1]|nr:Exosome complex component CSL4 [Spathaspora sp. JA1]
MSVVVPGQYITPVYKLDEANQRPLKFAPGRGTTISDITVDTNITKSIPVITSTILGTVHIKAITTDDQEFTTSIVTVVPRGQTLVDDDEDNNTSINLPKENDVVLIRVTRISPKQVFGEIISVERTGGNIVVDSGVGVNGGTAHVSMPPGSATTITQHNFNQTTIASSSTTTIQVPDIGENFRGVIRSQDIRSTERDKVKVIESYRPGDIVRAMIISLGDGSNYYLSTARNDLGVVFAKSENGAGSLMYPIDWEHMIDVVTGEIELRKNANPFI